MLPKNALDEAVINMKPSVALFLRSNVSVCFNIPSSVEKMQMEDVMVQPVFFDRKYFCDNLNSKQNELPFVYFPYGTLTGFEKTVKRR